MDTDTSFLGDGFTTTIPDPQERPAIGEATGQPGVPTARPAKRAYRRREARPEEPRPGVSVADITPEARVKAQNILDRIGKAFSENRLVSQSQAYEALQRDVADHASYLIAGGYLSMKELSELLMKLEEFRKRSSESGKTPATILAEWLRGGDVLPA